MFSIGIVLMGVGVICDVICMFMIGSSSFEDFQFVTILGTIAFIVGLFLTIFGRRVRVINRASGNQTAGTSVGSNGSEEMQKIGTNSVNTLSDATVEELKKFKSLLDSGVITQEEFDEKKKQLLK